MFKKWVHLEIIKHPNKYTSITYISITKNVLSRTKNHTIILNCGAPGFTNRLTTHPAKIFQRYPT